MSEKPGDLVKIRLAKKEIEGTLIQSYDSNIILLKLDSGYNIGIPKENIFGIDVIKKAKEKAEEPQIPTKKNLPTIGLIITGGTIASKLDYSTGGVKPIANAKELETIFPKIFETANIVVEMPFLELSENMTGEHWITLSEKIKKMLENPKLQGVIVTHGTDTLHYTSAALSFFLKNLNKPVVLTYSQRSIDRPSSDAYLNLRCAVRMALSECAQVTIVGHASLNDEYCYALSGTKTRKMHTSRRDTFKPINSQPIAKVWPDKIEFLSSYQKRNKSAPEIDALFQDKVALLKFYPGQSPEILEHYYREGYKGVIIEAVGLGHVAAGESKHSWAPTIKKLTKQGFIICAAAQTINGRLNPNVYATGRELEKAGIIFLEDILPETAFVKLGWVLAHRSWKTKIKEKMLENFSGEYSYLLTE